jgi:hypothetical protein
MLRQVVYAAADVAYIKDLNINNFREFILNFTAHLGKNAFFPHGLTDYTGALHEFLA